MKFTKRAEFKIRFLKDVKLRKFSMKAGQKHSSGLIDNHHWYHGCTADNYLKALRNGEDRFMMDRSPVLMSDVEMIGWVCYRRKR